MSATKRTVLSALFIAIAIVLPLAFHSVPNAGGVFLPMHIPVLLCGLICGFPYGLVCGIISPLLSSLTTGMPPAAMLPSMVCDLAVYGAVSAVLMRYVRVKNGLAGLYIALVGAMLAGRLVGGALNALIFRAGSYSMQLWLATSLFTALPGIVIQIILIPAIILALQKAKVLNRNNGN